MTQTPGGQLTLAALPFRKTPKKLSYYKFLSSQMRGQEVLVWLSFLIRVKFSPS